MGNFSRLKPSTKRHNAGISMAYGCTKDNNVYCYRRRPDGKTYLHRIVLGRGWEHTPFDVTKLSCYEKGEESMTSPTPTKEELLAIYQQCEGKIERRTTLTKAQYDAMNDDRMSALAIFCENQAVEQLRQDWAVSVFKHSRLSRERKLELIGQLLDWKVSK